MTSELKQDIDELRAETKADIAELRAETQKGFTAVWREIGDLRAETKAGFAELRAEIADIDRRLTIRMGFMLATTGGLVVAALQYFGP